MAVRRLDSAHDWTFGDGRQNYAVRDEAILQNCSTRIMCVLNDNPLEMTAGIDWLRFLNTPGMGANILQTLETTILQTPGVRKILSLDYEVKDRALSINYTISTDYTQRINATQEFNL